MDERMNKRVELRLLRNLFTYLNSLQQRTSYVKARKKITTRLMGSQAK